MKKDDLKKQLDADSLAEEAAHHISRRAANYSPPIAGTYLLRLRQELRAGVRAGDRLTTLRTRVRQVLTGDTPDRVDKIVRTEVIGGLNKGSLSAYNRSPVVEKKTWLTARDSRVRPTKAGHFNHQAADGQTVAKLDPFSVGGESLQHPGDPSGSAGNIIRCRCAMKPVISQVIPAAVEEPLDVAVAVPSQAPVQINDRRYKSWIDENIRNSPRTDFLPSPRGKRGRQIKSFFRDLEKVDDVLEKEALLGRRVAEKFRISDIINNVQEFGAEFRADAFASFDPYISSVTGFAKNRMKFNFGQFLAKTTSLWERAHGVIHEGFHGLQWGRGWYSRTEVGIKAGLMNPANKEAVRIKELWLKSVERAKNQLKVIEEAGRTATQRLRVDPLVQEATDLRLSLLTMEEEGLKARKLRFRIGQEEAAFGPDFGNSYKSGLANVWEDIADLGAFRSEAAGMKKAYGLHSPHEFGATNFELYVTAPTSLRNRNTELFDFFENFYTEGVFKRVADYIKEIADAFQRQNH